MPTDDAPSCRKQAIICRARQLKNPVIAAGRTGFSGRCGHDTTRSAGHRHATASRGLQSSESARAPHGSPACCAFPVMAGRCEPDRLSVSRPHSARDVAHKTSVDGSGLRLPSSQNLRRNFRMVPSLLSGVLINRRAFSFVITPPQVADTEKYTKRFVVCYPICERGLMTHQSLV